MADQESQSSLSEERLCFSQSEGLFLPAPEKGNGKEGKTGKGGGLLTGGRPQTRRKGSYRLFLHYQLWTLVFLSVLSYISVMLGRVQCVFFKCECEENPHSLIDLHDLVLKWCFIKTFQDASSRSAVATTVSLASMPPSSLSPPCSPSSLFYPFKRDTSCGTCLSSETHKPPDRSDGEYWTGTVCLSVPPTNTTPPPSGGASLSRQKQWIRLPSESTTEGLISKVFPLTVGPFFCQELLCDNQYQRGALTSPFFRFSIRYSRQQRRRVAETGPFHRAEMPSYFPHRMHELSTFWRFRLERKVKISVFWRGTWIWTGKRDISSWSG